MVRACSSVVEHYVDIVGVASSILATPTTGFDSKWPAPLAGFFVSCPASLGPCVFFTGSRPCKAALLC